MNIKIYLDDTRCKYISLNSDRNMIEINENERENILQLIEKHEKSLEDLINNENEEFEDSSIFQSYLQKKRKSLTYEEIVNKVTEKYKKKNQIMSDNDVIDEDEEISEDRKTRSEPHSRERRKSSIEEEEEKEKEKNEKERSRRRSSMIHKVNKSNNSSQKKRDIESLDLEQLRKEKEKNRNGSKVDSDNSSESEFKVDDYLKERNSFFFPWKAIYATEGPWKVRLLSRPLELDIIYKVYAELKLMQASGKEYMCNNIMAQILDLAHPSHQLQNLLLMYPLSASNILKKRLLNLGYKLVIPIIHEEINTFTVDTTLYILSQIIRKVEREMKFYFEVNATDNSIWRIGK